MSSAENAKIKLQGVEQLLIRLSSTEGAADNEMFLMLSDVISEIISELESSVEKQKNGCRSRSHDTLNVKFTDSALRIRVSDILQQAFLKSCSCR